MDQPTRLESIRIIAEPLIARASKDLCKQHCRGERYRWRCTIDDAWNRGTRDAPLCDRGNETYEWLWRDLLGGSKIEKFKDSGAEGIERYFNKTLSSGPFYERFKDMRYGDRVRVPPYILALGAVARRVFWLLRKQQPTEVIARLVEQSESQVDATIREIRARLQSHGALRLLHPVVEIALGDDVEESLEAEGITADTPTADAALTEAEEQHQVQSAFRKLSWEEQYVIEALTLDKLPAGAVLKALADEGIVIAGINEPGSQESKGAEQHLYYFHRKALARLRQIYESETRAPFRIDAAKEG